jgi:hypothetical protein
MLRRLSVTLLLSAAAWAHALTAADSGWVPVFNGADFNDFYQYDGGSTGKFRGDPAPLGIFKIEAGGVIHGANSKYSLLMTKKTYSYYKVRVDYKFAPGLAAGKGNAGMMILMDNEAAKTVTGVNRPRSIEVNCKRSGNDPWSLWGAKGFGPLMTTTIKAGSEKSLPVVYDPAGAKITTGVVEDPDRTIVSNIPNNENPAGEWNHGEAWVYGDSGVFFLNGKLRTASWHWTEVQGGKAAASGGIGLQAEENTDIWYRNFEIQELLLPIDGIASFPKGKFDINGLSRARVVMHLDGRSLAPLLREAPEGGNFKWLNAYDCEGRRVASIARARIQDNFFGMADVERNAGSGPYAMQWSSRP